MKGDLLSPQIIYSHNPLATFQHSVLSNAYRIVTQNPFFEGDVP